MTEDRFSVAVAALDDRMLFALADALLMRWLRAFYQREPRPGDLSDVYRVKQEWYEVAYRMETLIEEMCLRAEVGKREEELRDAVQLAQGT